MARKFSELRAKMPEARRTAAAERTRVMLDEMPLAELREARDLTQATLAQALGVEQGNVSKLERRTDMYISTLRRYIEAMGGILEIVAHFPDGSVRVKQFEDLAREDSQGNARRALAQR